MNPFVQKALDVCHTYPSSSATLEGSTRIPNPENLEWNLKRHPKTGGLLVDDRFRVLLTPKSSSISPSNTPTTPTQPSATMSDVFAIGDVSVLSSGALPATAQVANQEAKWLGKHLNQRDLETQAFSFRNLGILTYLGNWKAIMQTGGNNEVKGWMAWVIWRGAYLTQTISWRNKLLIPIYWLVFSIHFFFCWLKQMR
jgi:hypothetical protein